MPEAASDADPDAVTAFIDRWKPSGGRERANYQLFLAELCDLLDLPRPDPAVADAAENAYTFDRAITHIRADGSTSPRYIDLYRAGCFVLETKQGVEAAAKPQSTGSTDSVNPLDSGGVAGGHGKRGTAGYDKTMERARAQAEGYIRDLPAADGRPPFLIVCDIGWVFELYAEFTRSGGRYQRFPDPSNHRIHLDDLADPGVRDLLRTIWTDPMSLDPSQRIAKVTRDIADRLARLARSLETTGHHPETAATFLQRCLFTLFAEDIGLLPENGFLDLLRKVDENPDNFPTLVTALWKEMARGADYSALLFQEIAHFDGGLFEDATALRLDREQVDLLIDAAEADWIEVDPAIFGTLLERALDPRERHKLGAHYTPRSYVERLIEPTVIEPLREQWEAVRAAAVLLLEQGKEAKARGEVETFHHHLCQVRVLDPACGSGNFLYVTLKHMKQLEAEVLDFFETIGGDRTLEMDTYKVRPGQFWGLEINRSAVSIAQLVLWIGYFQWHHRTTGRADTNDRPLLPKQGTILHRDAVLDSDERIPRRDENGDVVQIWDGVTTKPHPVTGNEIPDESARMVVYDYVNPRRPEWPEADYVVGNPPFIGNKRMRDYLGDGYTEALRAAWKGDVPDSADFVMYWWERAAELLRGGKIERFGFITTNSIHQTFNRRVLERHLGDEKTPIHLTLAIPDHPWVDTSDGAAVRVAMTVAGKASSTGKLLQIEKEFTHDNSEPSFIFNIRKGVIWPNLRPGPNLADLTSLKAMRGIANRGVTLVGQGFFIDQDTGNNLIDSQVAKKFVTGRDIVQIPKKRYVIDLFGLSEKEAQHQYPEAYNHVLVNVKPERLQNKRKAYRDRWWVFAEPRGTYRPVIEEISTHLLTPRTARHRIFVPFPTSTIPESEVVAIGSDDQFVLGVLSSKIHSNWSLATGARLGVGNDPRYSLDCFETFPFPDPDEPTRERIRELGERLDAHHKRQQEFHPDLTLTGVYNVLEKLRAGEPLTDKERKIHDDGLVSVLREIHDDLDEVVFRAYGWDDLWERLRRLRHPSSRADEARSVEGQSPHCPPEESPASPPGDDADAWENDLLERLVALNHERAAEEERGLVRWLRPDFQNPGGAGESQSRLAMPAEKKPAAAKKAARRRWPDRLTDRIAAVRDLLPETGPDPAVLAARFGRKSKKREQQIEEVLEVLESLGWFEAPPKAPPDARSE